MRTSRLRLPALLVLRPSRVAMASFATVIVALGAVGMAAPPAALLADPTRPPAALATVASPRAALPAAGQAAAPGTSAPRADTVPPPPPLRLQSLRLQAGGRASALIDGREVKVGDTVGERVVLAIDADGVLLRSGNGPERRLRLLGGDEKQPPGTIQITRSARWQADPQTTPEPALAGAPAPARPAPVSIAERTHP